jgi:hypothetical protein
MVLHMQEPVKQPWYETARRWGQTNLTEIDGRDYDPAFWREHWKRTGIQGVIVNAGGIVAYYPSRIPLHYRAAHLGDRDLFGEIVADARAAGLAVLARMDCNRALPEFRERHPDWFVVRADGTPVETQGRFVACVNSPYYTEHIPSILREIIDQYHPDGFTDNSWTGAGQSTICHCPNCRGQFRDATGRDLPARQDWDDPDYRAWVIWGYSCRERNWDLFARVAREAGGDDCLWLGMVNANPFGSHLNFADVRSIGLRSKILMVDHQSRDSLNGMEQNAVNGLLLHEVAGQDTILPQSMAHYVRGPQAFRRASMPAEETRSWMRSGFAGGISPWWHHVGSVQEDRRQFETSADLLAWHKQHEHWLANRTPAASVALLWNQRTIDFYGRDQVYERCAMPWRGWTAALTRARIPFVLVHAADTPTDTSRFTTVILPDLAAMSEDEVDRIHRFVGAGGSAILTGAPGVLDDSGAERAAWPFEDLCGARPTGEVIGAGANPSSSWEVQSGHSYLRFTASALGERFIRTLGNTPIAPFGGTIAVYEGGEGPSTAASFIPPFPIYPPEFAWMRSTDSDVPAIATRELPAGGRLVLMPADIDRQHGRLRLPDLGEMLAESVRWASPWLPVSVAGPGTIACVPYRHADGLVIHLVNVTGCNEWPGYVERVVPVGPIEITIAPELLSQAGVAPKNPVARALVGGAEITRTGADAATFVIPELGAHEVLVIEK